MRQSLRVLTFSLAIGAVLAAASTAARAEEKQLHRVVTALDANNKSTALFDTMVPLKMGGAGEGVATIWVTQKAPADFSWTADRSGDRKGFTPVPNGTQFLIVDFPPVGPEVDKLPMDTMMKVVGADAPKRGAPPSNPLMHRTRTLDYALIVQGEIDMMLDTGPVHLKAGDVVVQQATNHAWLNHGKEMCRVVFVLMDSKQP